MVLEITFTYVMKSRLVVPFDEVADRERKHSGEGAFGHLGTSGKGAFGIRGARVPERKVALAFLGRLTLGHSWLTDFKPWSCRGH